MSKRGPQSSFVSQSKKRKASTEGFLPDVSSLRVCETVKTQRKVLQQAFDSLAGLDLLHSNQLSLLTEEQKFSWLILKFGWGVISCIGGAIKSIPTILTESQRSKLLITECKKENISVDDQIAVKIGHFLQEQCISALTQLSSRKLVVLCPPLSECPVCEDSLVAYHDCEVKVYTLNGSGVSKASKFTLRCKGCKLYFGYSQYGNKSELGFRYYCAMRPHIEVTDTVFVDRRVLEFQCSLGNHAWVSFQGFAEAYNDTFVVDKSMEMTAKTAARSFWVGEVENELRRLKRENFRFHSDEDIERAMTLIEEQRRENVYPHTECSALCKSRGCGELWVTDGIWSLTHPHCMYKMKHVVEGIPRVNLPDVCTDPPLHGKAFCASHCAFLRDNAPSIPTDLREFLSYCKVNSDGEENCESSLSDNEVESIEEVIDKLPETPGVGNLAMVAQGTNGLIEHHPAVVEMATVSYNGGQQLCRKDTGKSKQLRKWSRGHQFIVRGGGHIDSWSPLYKSESPSQVFVIILQWMLSLSKLNKGSLPKITLAYDNMCNLDKLKASKQLLPFDPPLDRMWSDVTKIIDVFHFSNHISPDCKVRYSPEQVKTDHPFWNTQAGEQTFSWLSRFKNIVCSMSKVHHMFYVHRMVIRRNLYTAKCCSHGKKPVLPSSTRL